MSQPLLPGARRKLIQNVLNHILINAQSSGHHSKPRNTTEPSIQEDRCVDLWLQVLTDAIRCARFGKGKDRAEDFEYVFYQNEIYEGSFCWICREVLNIEPRFLRNLIDDNWYRIEESKNQNALILFSENEPVRRRIDDGRKPLAAYKP